ncbi:ribosome maturation factor RimM [Aliikangiella sp. G2MR2-5]|uniref:ribosome maturation factor RimM n=1 Tax=Aliikangiella sp. G2MR2-5 TaxID=2788943 RepID=UPI0018AB6E9A|nr:ribosome maturation factor RimM [Aliikangiella sp. G2MR2-5]
MSDSPVIIGEITGVFGVKGWVKVFSHTEPRINIVKYNPWLIKQGKDWKVLKLISGRNQGKTIVAQIDGINDREQAHALIGCKIAINPDQLEKLGENEFYWRDLEGLDVVDLEGNELGRVSHLIETGANDVLVVKKKVEKGQKKQEMMIPYIPDDVIRKIDLDAGIITVDWDDEYL